jgi:hypothetical protein
MKYMIISVLTGVTGRVMRVLIKKLLEAIPGKYLIDSLVQENYRGDQACGKRKLLLTIIIIIAEGGSTFSKVMLNHAGRVIGSSEGGV